MASYKLYCMSLIMLDNVKPFLSACEWLYLAWKIKGENENIELQKTQIPMWMCQEWHSTYKSAFGL